MTYRSLGKCGTKVSQFGLGGWVTYGGSVTDQEITRNILLAAFDAGINFFDIADVYANGESERQMGKVLNELPRHRLVITSKLFWPMSDDVNDRGLSRKHIMESVEKSLQRIGTDYLDIYFCHRFDNDTPLEETVRAMDDLIHQGKILYWGTSEWSGKQIADAWKLCDRRGYYAPQVEQPQYNLVFRDKFENDVAPQAQELGVGTVVWSPLASGLLTGKYDNGIPPGSRLDHFVGLRGSLLQEDIVERVKKFAEISRRAGTTRTQLALAWTASHPAVSSVILGASKVEQLNENLLALDCTISPDLKAELEKLFAI